MRIIKPVEISGTIMSLLEEASEKVVLVSPYYNFSNWKKFKTVLQRAADRGVAIDFYVREDATDSINQVVELGYDPFEIHRLHAKLYFNEREAVITSMNLNQSSDDASLDIALLTESDKEYADVMLYFNRFIAPRGKQNLQVDTDTWMETLDNRLCNVFTREPWLEMENGILEIKGNNRYEVFIAHEKHRMLRLNCVLSEREYDFLKEEKNVLTCGSKISIELQAGKDGHYSLVWGTVDEIQSNTLHEMIAPEGDMIIDIIEDFIRSVEGVKEQVRERRRAQKS